MNEMEVISHLNVSVGLFPFTKILNLNIDHGPMCLAFAPLSERWITKAQTRLPKGRTNPVRQRLSLLRLGSRPDCFAVWSRMFR